MIDKVRFELNTQFNEVAHEEDLVITLRFADRALEQLDSKLTKVNFLKTYDALKKSEDALLRIINIKQSKETELKRLIDVLQNHIYIIQVIEVKQNLIDQTQNPNIFKRISNAFHELSSFSRIAPYQPNIHDYLYHTINQCLEPRMSNSDGICEGMVLRILHTVYLNCIKSNMSASDIKRHFCNESPQKLYNESFKWHGYYDLIDDKYRISDKVFASRHYSVKDYIYKNLLINKTENQNQVLDYIKRLAAKEVVQFFCINLHNKDSSIKTGHTVGFWINEKGIVNYIDANLGLAEYASTEHFSKELENNLKSYIPEGLTKLSLLEIPIDSFGKTPEMQSIELLRSYMEKVHLAKFQVYQCPELETSNNKIWFVKEKDYRILQSIQKDIIDLHKSTHKSLGLLTQPITEILLYILNKVQPLDDTVKLEHIINKEATTSFESSLSLMKQYVYLILDTQFLLDTESKLLEADVYAKNSKLIYEFINIQDKLTTLNEYIKNFIKVISTLGTLPSLNDTLVENFKQDIFEIDSASKELLDLMDTIKCY